MDIQIKTSTANVPITPTNNNYYNANLTSKPIKIDQLHPPKVRNITITTAKTIDGCNTSIFNGFDVVCRYDVLFHAVAISTNFYKGYVCDCFMP